MLPSHDPALPTELAVVGEHKDNPDELLLVAPDGHYYAYTLPDGNARPVEPDDDAWELEDDEPEKLFT